MMENKPKTNPLVQTLEHTARCKVFSELVSAAANAVRSGVANYLNLEMNDTDNQNWFCEVTMPSNDPEIHLETPVNDPVKEIIDGI